MRCEKGLSGYRLIWALDSLVSPLASAEILSHAFKPHLLWLELW